MSRGQVELTSLKRERAVDSVYQALRAAIFASVLRSGERLNIEDLALKLGVSLTPVRHAIQQLSAEGFIEIRPRSGTFVTSLSRKDVAETLDIRAALECLAAETAVELITAAELKQLRKLVREMRQPVRTEDDRKLHEQRNAEFHSILVAASRNRRLRGMYEALYAHLKIARIHAFEQTWTQRVRSEREEHEELLRLLEEKDKERFVAALRAHILRGKEALLGHIQEKEKNEAGV